MLRTLCGRLGTRAITQRCGTAGRVAFFSDLLEDHEGELHAGYAFSDFFLAPTSASIAQVGNGQYLNVDNKDIEKFLPEGLAGDTSEEFSFSGQNAWMIRDASKLVCGLIDGHNTSIDSSHVKNGDERTVRGRGEIMVPGLTDRAEWTVAQTKVSIYGKNVEVREEMNDTIDQLRDGTDGSLPSKVMLTGRRGSGKSVVLNQAVMHARSRGWLALFIPDGWRQVQDGDYIDPMPSGSTSSGQTLYNNTTMTVEALRGFLAAHADEIASIQLSEPAAADKYKSLLTDFNEEFTRARSVQGREGLSFLEMRAIVEDATNRPDLDALDADTLKGYSYDPESSFAPEAFSTLKDLVLLGVAFRSLSGLVFKDLVRALRHLDGPPVLVAVDGYNHWSAGSAFQHRFKAVQGQDICVPSALSFMSRKKTETEEWTLKNGICIGAVSQKRPEGKDETFQDVAPSIPLMINVPLYNQTEYLSAIQYYTHCDKIDGESSTQELLAFRTFSSSNPRNIRNSAVPFFFPLSVARHSQRMIAEGLPGYVDVKK